MQKIKVLFFCTFLDASKAFDKVNYCKLFNVLLKRELPVLTIRILANLHTTNFVCIYWGGTTTDYFSVINGVKQGAVLSAVLYCVYIDDLLLLLSRAGVGCYIGQHFVGALAYADDLVIIAPTASALRRLLVLCENYARDYTAFLSMPSNQNVWLWYLKTVVLFLKMLMIVCFILMVNRLSL